MLAHLNQNLNDDVVRDQVLIDQHPHKVKLGLTGRREADFDFLVAHVDEQLKHPLLLFGAHRVDEGLVAIAQVDCAPARSLCDCLCGPGAVGDVDGFEGRVALPGHGRGLLRRANRVGRGACDDPSDGVT